MKKLFLPLLSAVLFLSGCSASASVSVQQADSEIHLIEATDLHYIAPSLSDGPLFDQVLEQSDGKLSQYCEEITDAFIEDCIARHPDYVILSGDLAFNGEKASHERLAKKLKRLKAVGIQPLVIPGNHDILNPRSYDYSQDQLKYAGVIDADGFADIYKDAGYGSALYRDPSSLSYVYALSDTCWILMLDTCKYENNNTFAADSGGRIREEQLTWIEEMLQKAQEQNIEVISCTHHNVLSMTQNDSSYTIANSSALTSLYAQYGVQVNFSGHTHAQYDRTLEKDGSSITDIMTSSLAVSSHQYGVITLKPQESLQYDTADTDLAGYAEKYQIQDPFFADFKTNDQAYFKKNSVSRLTGTFADSGLSESVQQKLLELKGELNYCVFTGTISSFQKILDDSGLTDTIEKLPEEEKEVFTGTLHFYTHDAQHVTVSLNS